LMKRTCRLACFCTGVNGLDPAGNFQMNVVLVLFFGYGILNVALSNKNI
jgi:hypothetical protein